MHLDSAIGFIKMKHKSWKTEYIVHTLQFCLQIQRKSPNKETILVKFLQFHCFLWSKLLVAQSNFVNVWWKWFMKENSIYWYKSITSVLHPVKIYLKKPMITDDFWLQKSKTVIFEAWTNKWKVTFIKVVQLSCNDPLL